MADEETKEAPKKRVTFFTAGHCTPCEEIKDMLGKGQFLVDGEEGELDVIDIETEEGFEEAQNHDLSAVPSAFHEGKQCKVKIDEESRTVLIECDHDEHQAA